MSTSKWSSRVLSALLALVMVVSLVPAAAFAADVRVGKAGIAFGSEEAYQVTAKVTVTDGRIQDVAMSHDAAAKGHENSVGYADKAIAGLKGKFDGISADDRKAVLAVDTVSGATMTSEGLKQAVLNALDLDKADLTFGSSNKELQPGVYTVPISLRMADKHESESKAGSAFPAMGRLTVSDDGTAVLEAGMQAVNMGPISDMAYNVTYYKEDNYTSEEYPVTVLETTVSPDSMPSAGKTVPTRISFQIPDNHSDGVYMRFSVDAMGEGTRPEAWLRIDYANAAVPGGATVAHGSAKVDQFGKYTIHADVTVRDGVIDGVAVTADDFISETHRPTNETKIAKVTKALKDTWNGMAPIQENAEKIFKAIMNPQDPDHVIDTVTGATYSAKAVRDAVMDAFQLEYQDEIINVPESVEPGVYQVQIGYYSDVVWHSLVEDVKTSAILTVNDDKSMTLDFETRSGTEKEPLYILGFNGVYENNDRDGRLTMDGCKTVMGLSSNDYEDENFAKGTQVVNHVTFPLLGGLEKIYNTNCRLYVPAMKALNGDLSGIRFENGTFNADVFAKIYWDTMEKIEEPVETSGMAGTMPVTMLKENKDAPSMCDDMFAANAAVELQGPNAVIRLLVANPIPGYPDEGKDGTIKDMTLTFQGKKYKAESLLGSGAMMTVKKDNTLFGLKKGEKIPAQVLSFTVPKAVLEAGTVAASAYVNVVMNSDVDFRIQMGNVQWIPAPAGFQVTVREDGKPYLTWDTVEGADKYEIQRADGQGDFQKFYATSKGTSDSLRHGSAKAGETYTYRIRAIVDGYAGTWAVSEPVQATLAAPEIHVTVNSKGKPVITWDKVAGAQEYEVLCGVPDASFEHLYGTKTGTHVTHGTANTGATYVYAVIAKANGVESQLSKRITVTALAAPVTHLENRASDGKPVLTWDQVPGADHYDVYRKVGKNGSYKLLKGDLHGTSLRNGSAKAGTTYYYYVVAVSAKGGESLQSAVKYITCDLARPDVTARLKDGKPYLTWDKVSGAIKYEVYRSVNGGSYKLLTTVKGTSLRNGSAKSGQTCKYRVKAICSNKYGNSALSYIDTVKVK